MAKDLSFGVEMIKKTFGLMGALLLTMGTPAQAQQSIDEPFLDPIFGTKRPRPAPPVVTNDDEFDGNAERAHGLVGIFTFLVPDTTDLSIGLGPVYKPDYFGSNDYELKIDPQVYVKFNNFVFFDDDGADFALFGFSRFSFGPSIRIVGNRNEDENPALQGLGDIGRTFELGGFAATNFADRVSVRLKARKGIATGHRGWIVDASSTALLFRWGRVSTSVSAQASWIDGTYADAYFSVTPEQSAASGLDVFDAGSGIRDFGGSLNAFVNVGKHWSVNPYVSYRYILNEYADTPIIADLGERNQYVVGFHLMRQFQLNMF